jgi:hypothetical protein
MIDLGNWQRQELLPRWTPSSGSMRATGYDKDFVGTMPRQASSTPREMLS